MGRLTQGHFDDVFLNKIKQACIHVLDQLNEANEIDQAFDLCPSISRRNRVILSFLRDADQVTGTVSASQSNATASSSTSSPLPSLRPPTSIRPSRQASLGTDSVASLSAQRRRRETEMQYVRDPNDSNDDSDSQATIGPSSSANAHLDPASARNPSMSQPDYTFEQFVDHLDPTDKLLKRSFEIIIKETARQALAKKRDPSASSPASSSAPLPDPSASLRSAIASSQLNRPSDFDPYRSISGRASRHVNMRDSYARSAALDHTYQLLRSLRSSSNSLNNHIEARGAFSGPSNATDRTARRTLRDFLLTSTDGLLGSTQDLLDSTADPSSFTPRAARTSASVPSMRNRSIRILPRRNDEPSTISPDSLVPQLAQRRSAPRPTSTLGISPQTISARLAEASRRNAEAARAIGEAERLRSSQFIRTSIESLRASLFQLHMDLACTQLQHAQRDNTLTQHGTTPSNIPDIGSSYALVMDTIELFDDTLRRLSCLVSNTNRDGEPDRPVTSTQQNADSSQMRTSLWRARNLLLLSSMARRPNRSEDAPDTTDISAASSRDAELSAHRHLFATMEESHWSRADVQAPSSDSIRAWRRKLAAWYHLDRDATRYPDPPRSPGDREETYARWHPDLELPYALDDEILAPMTADAASARPDPIADPRGAWLYARRHDTSLPDDLNQDADVRAALEAGSVASALQQLLTVRAESEVTQGTTNETGLQRTAADQAQAVPGNAATMEVNPDVSLTRTTSLIRRNAVRGQPLTNSDASSIRSARSSLSLRHARDPSSLANQPVQPAAAASDDNDAVEEDVVETSIEIGTVPHSPVTSTLVPSTQQQSVDASGSSLLPPPDRPRAGRSGSFTFITTPAAVLRSRQRSQSRSGPRSQSPAPATADDDGALDEDDSAAEEYIDLDLDLGMAGEDDFDFNLVEILRSESRRNARRGFDDDAESSFADDSPPPRLRRTRDGESVASGSASPTGIRVFVSGSGASTPAEARQATFEAYAQRARLLERRRRMERQRQGQDEDDNDDGETRVGGGNGSEEPSSESRRRRRGRYIGDSSTTAEDNLDRRNSLPFPRGSER
ncbi:uncharacterized protein UTRI_05848_B [Ustilago trichophora]|uniref:Uncharacterized protein n=1 Tax=Ustilago trichophora TaxID=86804 RepID=A0A5C3ENN1_9BASI|nr:uncharacterized protein UTRI_05848_B [Ustilago trichophora]